MQLSNKYDKQLEQVCKSIQCISMAVLLGCVMLKVSLYKYYKTVNMCFKKTWKSRMFPKTYDSITELLKNWTNKNEKEV